MADGNPLFALLFSIVKALHKSGALPIDDLIAQFEDEIDYRNMAKTDTEDQASDMLLVRTILCEVAQSLHALDQSRGRPPS